AGDVDGPSVFARQSDQRSRAEKLRIVRMGEHAKNRVLSHEILCGGQSEAGPRRRESCRGGAGQYTRHSDGGRYFFPAGGLPGETVLPRMAGGISIEEGCRPLPLSRGLDRFI